MLLALLLILAAFAAAVWLFMQQPSFGRLPSGPRLARIRKSPHYRKGAFRNLSPTPDLTEGTTYAQVFWQYFFLRSSRRFPSEPMPSVRHDLHALAPERNVLVWFGHSSYFLQVDGRRMLVDPVFSGAAAPFPSANRAFPGTDVYRAEDLPELDVLFLTHDHWDHLDYKTVTALRAKTKLIVTGLGTGAHLERWGFPAAMVQEKDWNERLELGDGFVIDALPARHFSGRGFRRNQTLWMSFALKTPSRNLYLGGDSGYDTHFAAIGRHFGPFDMAVLECGQYNPLWKYIHNMPEEVVQAALDLGAKRLLPVHWGKFAMAMHDWDEPLKRVKAAAAIAGLPLLLPVIGEVVEI